MAICVPVLKPSCLASHRYNDQTFVKPSQPITEIGRKACLRECRHSSTASLRRSREAEEPTQAEMWECLAKPVHLKECDRRLRQGWSREFLTYTSARPHIQAIGFERLPETGTWLLLCALCGCQKYLHNLHCLSYYLLTFADLGP